MKKIVSFALMAVMLCVMVLSLASCSSYSKIEKNFLNADYKVVDTSDDDGNNYLSFVAGLENDAEVKCTVHILKKSIGTYAVILEYGANEDAKKALEEHLTKGDIENLKKVDETSKLVNGNCVLIPVSISINAANNVEEMIDLFNK